MRVLLLVALALASVWARADENVIYPKRPKWELGLNLGEFYLPDYPGADMSHFRFLPLPYVVYRGEFLRSDENGGVRGAFLNTQGLDVDISAATAFPVDSSQNDARAGMPSLDWMFALGPRVLLHLYHGEKSRVDMGFAARAVYSISLTSLDSRGFDFLANLRYRHSLPLRHPAFVELICGGLWASDKLMQYFYEVPPEYATPSRPAYSTHPGFLGENISAFVVRPVADNWSVYAGAIKNFYSESADRSSPLMLSIESETYFVGVYWSALKSKDLVVVQDE